MSLILVVLGVVGVVAGLNGLRPLRWTPVVLPAFFAAWLTVELAPQLLVLTVVATVVLSMLGGFSWLGLALAAASCSLLAVMVRTSLRAADVADAALADWPEAGEPEPHQPTWLRRFFVPMAFSHPDVTRVVDVPYGEHGRRNTLDVYHRVDKPTGCPTLVQVHGGAWVIGDKREQGRPLMLHLAARGWVCFAPNYRLSPRATWPDHLVDVKRAIAWVREHGHEYGADPGFLVVTGGSAGGQIAALCGLTADDPQWQPGFEDADTSVQAVAPYYGVYDLQNETGTTAARVRASRLLARLVMKTKDPAVYASASPVAQVRDAPPFLVVHGANDTLVPVEEARLLVQRLREVSSEPVLYLELPGTQHAFDVFPSIRSDAVVRAVARFCELARARARA